MKYDCNKEGHPVDALMCGCVLGTMICMKCGKKIYNERAKKLMKHFNSQIVDSILNAIQCLKKAQELNDLLQKKTVPGSVEWQYHESIDDQLHEALTDLGD